MTPSKKHTIRHVRLKDFIGKHIIIVNSTDPTAISLQGIVVNETKNLLELSLTGSAGSDSKKPIKLPKRNITFELYDNKQRYEIRGKDIVCAPEKRTKKLR